MQRNGLEWLFRMASEPRRLSGRYIQNNPAFVYHAMRQLMTADLARRQRSKGKTAER
jgi:N-acetylglucosaminyldiphosphoundecaprenol N-acetyl-beta-D-mannosaminyltransferase